MLLSYNILRPNFAILEVLRNTNFVIWTRLYLAKYVPMSGGKEISTRILMTLQIDTSLSNRKTIITCEWLLLHAVTFLHISISFLYLSGVQGQYVAARRTKALFSYLWHKLPIDNSASWMWNVTKMRKMPKLVECKAIIAFWIVFFDVPGQFRASNELMRVLNGSGYFKSRVNQVARLNQDSKANIHVTRTN